MRILIDLQGAQNGSRHRGIGRYCMALAKAIVRHRGSHEIFILLNGLFPETIDEIRVSFFDLLQDHHFIVFNAPGPVDELIPSNTWRVRSAELLYENLINDVNPDIFLIGSLFEGACDNTVSSVGHMYSNVQTAVILYDLIPYLDPEKYIGWEPAKNWYYRKIDSLKKADLLLAISNSAQREAIDHLGINAERTINISSAADASFKKSSLTNHEIGSLFKRYGIKRKFLMHSSAFEERKNFEGLINAFALLPNYLRTKFQLVLVCKLNESGRLALKAVASSAGLENDEVVLTGFVPDNDLINLYSECHLFVFPSFHEGFGLPALEAMCCGAPTIGSNTTSIPEVLGRDDALFDPSSIESIANLIATVLTDSALYQSLKMHAITQSKKFSWDQCAKIAMQGFEKLLANKMVCSSLNTIENAFAEFVESITAIESKFQPSDEDLVKLADAIDENESNASRLKSSAAVGGSVKWRIEGPFDSTYSLALLNRETARGLNELGHFVVLHSTEGPGDFPANPNFLALNSDLNLMYSRSGDFPQSEVDVTSRNLYPPRVEDMESRLNLLHRYAWEETGFPQAWVVKFNDHLQGITCLSNHVEKILIDNGVSIPMRTSGCGVDHWEHIRPATEYEVKARKFRFLHVSSCFPRKGADLLLDAYGLAFSSNDDVSLIIKTFENPHNDIQLLLTERQSKNPQFPDVKIIVGDLSDSELKALYQQCHVLVAPSKAEGFGLPLAEAMLSGLPVITTAWGGQLDFCDEENSWLVDYDFEYAKTHFGIYSSAWAKIKVNELAKVLIEANNSSVSFLSQKANAGRKKLLDNFKWVDVVGRDVNAARSWSNADSSAEVNAKIGWITTWNTKCGIATYSKHLISNMPGQVTVLAPHLGSSPLISKDESNCIRSWNQGKGNNNLSDLAKSISEKSLNTIVIQFNYGFFEFSQLSEFIDQQLRNGMIIVVMMHSTVDPFDAANWKLVELQLVLARCHRIFVHSIADLNRFKDMGLTNNVALFPHGVNRYSPMEIMQNIDEIPLIASYGFCLPHKGLAELIEAVGILKEKNHFVRLRMLNAEYPDPVSTQLVLDLKNLIHKLGLEDRIEMYTDYLADEKSLALLSEANLIVFPYQQTGESSSAAVRTGLSTLRPIAVTPLRIFDDIGDAAFRFSGTTSKDIAAGIAEYLSELTSQSEKSKHFLNTAKKWCDQHSYIELGKRLLNVCTALVRKSATRTYRFNASSPLLRTMVGSIQGKSLATTGSAGCLIYGPYLSLPEGQYRIKIYGTLGASNRSCARVDITSGRGKQILAEFSLSEPDEQKCMLSAPIFLESASDDLEIRVWVDEECALSVHGVEIIFNE